MSPRIQPISAFEASTLYACTIGQRSTPQPAPSASRKIRKVLGLESVKDEAGNVIREAPLPFWANFRQRALDTAIAEINNKTDLYVETESVEKLGPRVNAFKLFGYSSGDTNRPLKIVKTAHRRHCPLA
jgi:Initiator Replication protein